MALDDDPTDFLAGILNDIARTADAQQHGQAQGEVTQKAQKSESDVPEGFQSTKRRGSDEQESTKLRRTEQAGGGDASDDDDDGAGDDDDDEHDEQLAAAADAEFSSQSDSDTEPRRAKRPRKPSAIAAAAAAQASAFAGALHQPAPGERWRNPARMGPRQRTSPEHQFLLEKVFATDPLPNTDVRKLLAQQMKTSPRRVQIWFQNRRATVKRIAKERGDASGASVNFRSTRTPLSAAALATLLASENEVQHRYEQMRLSSGAHDEPVAYQPSPAVHHVAPWIASATNAPTLTNAASINNVTNITNASSSSTTSNAGINLRRAPPPTPHAMSLQETAVNLARMSIHSLLSNDYDNGSEELVSPPPPPPTARSLGESPTYSLPSINDLINM